MMGILSLVLTVVGIVSMLVHYAVSSVTLGMPFVIVTGIITTVAFLAAYILGTREMKKQSAGEGIRVDMFNPALLAHGMAGTLLVVGSIMCVLGNIL